MNDSFPSRILVVDDDADAAWALASMLRSELGCDVHTATSGAEAIDQASCNRPELVIVDIVMPRIDGIEVAAIIRRLFAPGERPRLVALTGLDVDAWPGSRVDETFDLCLRKPLEFDALVQALRLT